MCIRCEELEERVAWLESELGIQRSLEAPAAIRSALGIRPGAAKMLWRLYAAKGKPVTRYQLLDVTARDGGDDDRGLNNVSVGISRIRAVLGEGTVQTVWGEGYWLTPVGMSRVAEIIGEPLKVAA